MTKGADTLVDHVYRLVAPAALRTASDCELLTAFVSTRHQTAFSVLVARHGPMVLSVCRRVVGDTHTAEDAFQAVFLVLARKAGTLRRRQSLAAWLYGVAYRVALNARRAAKRRPRCSALQTETNVVDQRPDPLAEVTARDLLRLIEEEVQRLPSACRLPVVLCCLDGLSIKEAAGRLCLTEGAVKGHLERGRARLQARMVKRGLTLSAGLALADATRGCVWARPDKCLVDATARAGITHAGRHKGQPPGVTPEAMSLAQALLRGQLVARVKMALAVAFLMGVTALGAGTLMSPSGVPRTQVAQAEQPIPNDWKPHKEIPGAPLRGEKKRPALVAQLGDEFGTMCVAFSPDGKQVLTVRGVSARLWDAASGKLIRIFHGHTGGINSVAFSADGKLVLTGSDDTTARLWDVDTGKEICKPLGHPNPVTCVGLSPDGGQAVTVGMDISAQLWDLATSKEVRSFKGHSDVIWSVAFSPDGTQILTGSRDNTARLWDATTGREIRQLKGHTGAVQSVTFSTNGKQLLTGSRDKTVRLWDLASGREIRSFSADYPAVFSPDGKRVLTAASSNSARLWDAATGKEIHSFKGHTIKVTSVAFSTDGKQVLTGTKADPGRLWDCATGKEVRSFHGNASQVLSVAFSPDGKQMLTGNMDTTARLWDGLIGKEVRVFQGHTDVVSSVSFSSDGTQVLTGSQDKTVRLWNTGSGKEVRRYSGRAPAVFSPDGKQVLMPGANNSARLLDAATGKEIRKFLGHTEVVGSVAFSPDGMHVLTGSVDLSVKLWDVAGGNEVRSFLGNNTSSGLNIAFSPDGKQVVIGSSDKKARVWDVDGVEVRGTFEESSIAAFSPDGKQVLTGGVGDPARLRDAVTGRETRRFEGPNADKVAFVAFSSDGKQVLTGIHGGCGLLWDCATGRELCQLVSFRDGTWAVLDPAGRYDSSNNGDIEWLHGVVGNEIIPLKQLKADRYDPGLLAKYMGFNKEPLRELPAAK
jgi:RNA polymerase sigma factor (sigma-70 family)